MNQGNEAKHEAEAKINFIMNQKNEANKKMKQTVNNEARK